MKNREEIFEVLKTYLMEDFEIEAGSVTLDADLAEDLDLDSIDAVDLVVKFQKLIGKRIPAEEFKTVRTVGDVVERVYENISR